VGCDLRPENVPKGITFYRVDNSALSFFITVSDGLYLYRAKDSQLLSFHGNFEAENQAPIKSVHDDYQTKDFFSGYMMGRDDRIGDVPSQNLLELHKKYVSKVDFLLVRREESQELVQGGRFLRQLFPLFFVFNSGQISYKRWYIDNSSLTDLARRLIPAADHPRH
jgi:hypothetical protein